jgi:hypothetical protein
VTTDATAAASAIVRRHRNLVGVPSYHYEPVFGGVVHEVVERERPDAVALELPPSFRRTLEWGARCWPDPVAGISEGCVVPLVPGDSILEAFRAAQRVQATVALVDIDTPKPGQRAVLPGAELADRSGADFFDVADGVGRRDPDDDALAREAVMARKLAGLMRRHRLVLWVGGLAHWTRIIGRLERGDFEAPSVPVRVRRRFERARLDASALLRRPNNWPAFLRAFADDPRTFDPYEEVRALLHEAAGHDPDESHGAPECVAAIDIARTGLYARNLAASSGLREIASLGELLQAAHATIGPRYAARVYAQAMEQRFSATTASLDALTFEVDPRRLKAGFKFRGRWIALEPWNPPRFVLAWLPDPELVGRTARDAQYDRLPGPRAGERFYWGAYPPDEAEWEAFVQYLLRRASVSDPGEARAVPFCSGLEDGIDVRATIRHWAEDVVYVKQDQRGQMNFTNGAIDWTSDREDSDILQGRRVGGWNDPDSPHVGSASREFEHEVLQDIGEAQVTERERTWTVLTLDCPTHLDHPRGRRTFFDAVIDGELLKVQGRDGDNVYAWLEGMFRFCGGKPFVYFSRYVPGPRIRALAKAHDVDLVWSPLHRVPQELLRRHRHWRQLWLTESQWEVLKQRLDASKSGSWDWTRLVQSEAGIAGSRRAGKGLRAPRPVVRYHQPPRRG